MDRIVVAIRDSITAIRASHTLQLDRGAVRDLFSGAPANTSLRAPTGL